MAIISKIREKAGWTVGLIAISLGMFVLGGDLLSSTSWLLGTDKQIIGVIDGHKVELQEFEKEYNMLKTQYKQLTGINASGTFAGNLREQAWQRLIVKYVYEDEYEELGVRVPNEEMIDMIQGNNIDPNFASNFLDSTGQINRSFIKYYLQNIPQEQRANYAIFEKDLKTNRLEVKYRNIFALSRVITTIEAEKDYIFKNTQANIDYYYLPYHTVPDSLIDISNSELKAYYKSHKKNYKTEPKRNIQYLYFSINPTEDDIAEIKRDVDLLRVNFEETSNDTTFVNLNNDLKLPIFDTLAVKDIQGDLIYNDLEVGKVYGPILANDKKSFILYKILDRVSDVIEKEKFAIARLGINITPSEQTYDQIYREVNTFLPENRDFETLKQNVENYKKNTDSSIILLQAVINSPNQPNINNLTGDDLRAVFHWAYDDDTDLYKVSDIIDLNEAFMIAVVTHKEDEKYETFEKKRIALNEILMNKAKRSYLEELFEKEGVSGSLNELKKKYPGGNIYTDKAIVLDGTFLEGVGNAPEAIAYVSKLEENDISKPIFTEKGGTVFIKVNTIEKPLVVSNYNVFKQLLKSQENSQFIDLTTTLNDMMKIKNKTYLYY